ncbi:MAG: hypothetical protein QM817_34360 [Archangium sp.]
MLLNVRLGAEEEKIVRGLRRARVNVSELVRRAIRENAPRSKGTEDRVSLIEEIIRAHPDEGPHERRPALDDRRAMSNAIRQQLRKQR